MFNRQSGFGLVISLVLFVLGYVVSALGVAATGLWVCSAFIAVLTVKQMLSLRDGNLSFDFMSAKSVQR